MAKKRKRLTALRFRKGDPSHNLSAATQHWVSANGGQAFVIGGIGIMNEENIFVRGSKGKFLVCISCLGQKPIKNSA